MKIQRNTCTWFFARRGCLVVRYWRWTWSVKRLSRSKSPRTIFQGNPLEPLKLHPSKHHGTRWFPSQLPVLRYLRRRITHNEDDNGGNQHHRKTNIFLSLCQPFASRRLERFHKCYVVVADRWCTAAKGRTWRTYNKTSWAHSWSS